MNISVIITCYSEGYKILKAIKSVEDQGFQNYELVIVNDKSSHESTNLVCKELAVKGYTVIWRQENGGLSAARNTGILKSNNEIIVPLDADDVLPTNSLALIHYAFIRYSSDFIFGNYSIQGNDSKIVNTSVLCNDNMELDGQKLAKNWILLGTSPFKRSLWESINGYDEDKWVTNSVQDIDFFMRAMTAGKTGRYLPETIYQWNDSFDSMNKQVKSEAYCYLNLKNQDFLRQYRFSSKRELKNYLVTMLYGNKLYDHLRSYFESETSEGLNLKNKIKYLLVSFKYNNGRD